MVLRQGGDEAADGDVHRRGGKQGDVVAHDDGRVGGAHGGDDDDLHQHQRQGDDAPDTRFGGCGTTIDVISNNALKREVEVVGSVLADECLGLLKAFFQQMRLEKGDSGNKGN